MCGICGFVSTSKISFEHLKIMNDTMEHRGPNDSGEEIFNTKNKLYLGMAHRRLSILDLSERGHQPFHSNNDDVIVVFNGEIYNYKELKSLLTDYIFKSDCDTEVIIAAYKKWGLNFVSQLRGMFAIGLYDVNKDILILARDHIGKKPLYYYRKDNHFVFSSTLSPIMKYPFFKKEINTNVIPRFLYNRYISGEETIYENVYRLNPGELVCFDGNKITKKRYWNFVDEYHTTKIESINDYGEAKKYLKKELIESVKKRMVADVPVGAFLSGGYDSSLVTAIAQSLSEEPLKTYSIGFEDEEYDEAPYAQEIAKHLGTSHTNHYVTEQEMLDLVASIPIYYDEPFADSSQIPSMLVAKIAKKDVTVAITGDGGDELFCGYNMYDKLYLAQKIEPVAYILRFFVNDKFINKLPYKFKAILENADDKKRTQLGRRNYEQSISKMLNCDETSIPYDESLINENNWQIRRMLLDSITYLPDNNLCKVDRATMKYSLEARNPLLDISVVKSSFKIPHKFKYHKKDKKHILKDISYEYIPKELLDRSKKGFAVPIDKWLRGVLKEELIELTSKEYLQEQGIFNVEYTYHYVKEYLKKGDKGAFSGQNPSNIIWPLFMFQKWYQYHIKSEVN